VSRKIWQPCCSGGGVHSNSFFSFRFSAKASSFHWKVTCLISASAKWDKNNGFIRMQIGRQVGFYLDMVLFTLPNGGSIFREMAQVLSYALSFVLIRRFRSRVARWFIFKPKIPIWVKFGLGTENVIIFYDRLEYVRPFGIIYGRLV
jgi:hypothetical protein